MERGYNRSQAACPVVRQRLGTREGVRQMRAGHGHDLLFFMQV